MAKTSKLCLGVFSKAHQQFSQRGYMHRALWLALQFTVFAVWQISGADLTWHRTSLDQFGADIAVAVHPDGSFLAADGFDIQRSVNLGTNWSTVSGFATFAGGSFAIDPSDSSILYAGRSHGLLKSASGGTSWFELADLHAGGSANAIVVAPSEPSTVYVGVGYGWGVYKSLNRGGTWTHVLESRDVTALAVDPSDPLVVLAGTIGYYSTPGGVLQSRDGGINWTQYLSGMDVTAIAFDSGNPPIAYAGTSADGIFRSADGGQTWDALAGTANIGPVTALVVHPAFPQQVFVAISAAGIYASVDGGISWNPQNAGLSDLNVKALAIRPNFPFTLLAGTVGGQGFWTNPDLSSQPPAAQAPQIVTQPQDQTVVSGQSETLVVEATGTGPLSYQWYVGSSGDTSQPIAGATEASYTTSALTEATSFWVRVSNAAGSVDSQTVTVTVSATGAAGWQAVTVPGLAAGANFYRLWTRAPGEVYVWAYSGPAGSVTSTLYRLYQGQWQLVLQVSGEYPASVFGTGASEVFAATQSRLWRSTDNGTTWTLQPPPLNPGYVLQKISGTIDNVQVVAYNPSNGDSRSIYRFNGTSWTTVLNNATFWPLALDVFAPNEGYAVSCWGWARWDGSAWNIVNQGFDFCDIGDTWAVRDAQGLHWWAVGNNNFSNGIRVWCWDAASGTFGSKRGYCFSDGDGYNVGSAYGIWGASANDVYVFGGLASTSGGARSGRIYHFNGSVWTRLAEPDLYPNGVWGTGPDDVWIAGNEGKLFHLTAAAAQAPQIVMQPENQTVVSGQSATLKVEVTGTDPLNYQWYVGQSGDTGQPITGATQASYNTSALTETTSFWVRVSNAAGSIDSKTVTVTVTLAEVASWQAVSVPGLAAGTDFHRIWTRGLGEVYVWAYSGPAAAVASTLYRLHQEQWQPVLEVNGEYPASVFGTGSNEVFAATQNQLWRSTDNGDTWTQQTVPGSGEFLKISGTANNVHVVRLGSGIVRFDGSQWSAVFNDSVNPVYTFTVLGPAEGYYVTCWGWGTWNGSQWQYHAQGFDFCDIYDTWAMRDAQGLHWWAVGNNNFANGIRVWCWEAASGTFGSKSGYCFSDGNGYNVGSAYGVWGSSANDVYVIGDLANTDQGTRSGRIYHFAGGSWTRLTEPDLYPRGVWGTASNDVWIAGLQGKLFHLTVPAAQAPQIATQPQDQTVVSGQSATLAVEATGIEPLSYQWYVRSSGDTGQPITGATQASYNTSALTETTSFWVRVSNAAGSIDSKTVTVTISSLPLEPPSLTIALYAGITIIGQPGLTYEIQFRTDLDPTDTWHHLADVQLIQGQQLFVDQASAGQPRRFYRALALP